MNQSILILILSITVLCVGGVWLARKKRRASRKAAWEFARGKKFASARPTRPEGQIAHSLETVVQQGEAKAIINSPEDVAGGFQPSASDSETVVEAEAEGVQTGPRINTPSAASVSEASTQMQAVHVSPDANEPQPPEHAGSTEEVQTLVAMKGESSTAPLVAGEPVPAEDQSEVEHDQGLVLGKRRMRPSRFIARRCLAATNGGKTGKLEARGSATEIPIQAAGSTDEVPQPVTPEPERPEAGAPTKPKQPPKYPGLRPTPVVERTNQRRPPALRFPADQESELHLRVHLVFDRHGSTVRRLSLIPDSRPGMVADLEVAGTQGDFVLCPLEDRCQDVVLPDIGSALRDGVEWRGKGSARCWRWVLGGRELYVLAPGDYAGLNGFLSVTRLLLGEEHVVLAATERRVEALAALARAGCAEPMIMDETVEGVPAGWLLLRSVKPTRPIQGRDEADILNVLCPLAEITPHFAGGIRLAGRTWLLGHPPRILFTGDTSGEFEVKINRESASFSPEGGYIAPGWDTEGRHSLWFAGRLRKYLLVRGTEQWNAWRAHDFGTGAAICGACTLPQNEARCHQVRVPVHNPVLVGAVPGQIFRCDLRPDVRADSLLAFVPFAPVWALPLDSLHADKRTAGIFLAGTPQRVRPTQINVTGRKAVPALAAWCAAINDAGRKGLPLATEEKDAPTLWQEYRRAAKQLWRKMR